MPPRRRGRAARSPSEASAERSQAKHTPSAISTPNPTAPEDCWTTDQEIALLKLLIKNTPLGYQKHMKMLSIYLSLKAEGHTHVPPPKGAGEGTPREHMRIPNIWRKLASMYDLEELDRRQDDAHDEREAAEHGDTAAAKKTDDDDADDAPLPWKDFSLERPGDADDDPDDYGDRMFRRRLRDSADPPSSPSAIPSASGRGKASAPRTRRMRGRGSRATTDTGDDVDMEDGDGDEGGEEDDGDDADGDGDDEENEDEGDDDDDEEEETTTQTRSMRGSTRASGSVRRGKRKR